MSDLDGKIQIQADIVPTNDNPRMYTTQNKYVKGAAQTFQTLTELVAFHPNRLIQGQPATIINWPTAGVITDFRLSSDPAGMVDSNGNSLVTQTNFLSFWVIQSTTNRNSVRVQQYAPDGTGGGTPTYPYTLATESNWSNIFDATKGHRWMRFRDDDVDSNADGIFDNWSVPISIGVSFQTGDYVENRFLRQALNSPGTIFSTTGGMTIGAYYVVESKTVTLTGTLANSDLEAVVVGNTVTLTVGRVFKHDGTVAVTFNSGATIKETIKTPVQSINGVANNEPPGWTDTVPGGVVQLWSITGQKSVYGQLKSPWTLKQLNESPDFIRYSNSPTPDPTLSAGVNTPATSGSGGDTALIAAGWTSVYNDQYFMATRDFDPGPNTYYPWLVQKINGESGEYVDRVYKLFDMNLAPGSIFLVPPTLADATKEGWSDTPVAETSTQINYESQARKFFDGSLKTPWAPPVPYTGKDTFIDVIDSNLGDNFKYDQVGGVVPASITLQANLYKGTASFWEDPLVTISYVWVRVYNNGAIDTSTPTTNTSDPFYTLGVSGLIRNQQRVVIKPAAVTGMAVFQCTQTVTLPQGGNIVFVDTFTVLDVTDGKDLKDLSVTADNDRTVYDTVNTVFVPATIIIRAYWANLGTPTLKWYRWNGSAWVTLTGDANYTLVSNTASFLASVVFASSGSAEEQRYAVSTHATNPDSADNVSTFSDYITIVKLSAASTGTAGANAKSVLLNNESHLVQLDTTFVPLTGEIGSGNRATTKLEVFDGTTRKIYGTDYTLALSSDNANITFSQSANGSDANVYVNTWANAARAAVCTITITLGAVTLTKKFSIASTTDAPGAFILDIDSDNGYVFTPTNKANKTLTAKLYDTSQPPASQLITLPNAAYTFRWNVNNVWGSNLTTTYTQVVQQTDILSIGKVTLECYKNGTLFRSQTINMTDVNDGKAFRAWTDNATKPTAGQILTNQNPNPTGGSFGTGDSPVTLSGVSWYLPTAVYWATHTPAFAQDATFGSGVYSWAAVYQMKGEKGDQGVNGNFIFPMYQASAGAPALGAGGGTSTLAQMQAAGWLSLMPGSGVIWRTERLWTGQGVTFDGSGNPSTGPVSGGVWTNPVKIVATDGGAGPVGPTEYDSAQLPWMLVGGGTVTWRPATQTLSWTERVMAIPINPVAGSNGYFELGFPVTVTVPPFSCLYYVPPVGAPATYNPSYWVTKVFTDSQAPGKNWIPIAVHNGDTGALKWLPGPITFPGSPSNGGIYYPIYGRGDWMSTQGNIDAAIASISPGYGGIVYFDSGASGTAYNTAPANVAFSAEVFPGWVNSTGKTVLIKATGRVGLFVFGGTDTVITAMDAIDPGGGTYQFTSRSCRMTPNVWTYYEDELLFTMAPGQTLSRLQIRAQRPGGNLGVQNQGVFTAVIVGF